MRIVSIVAALCVSLCSADVASARGGGDPGYNLVGPATVGIGTTFQLQLTTSHQSVAILFFSTGSGPTVTPLGTFCLDFPPAAAMFVPMFPVEDVTVSCPIACNRNLIGQVGYLQYYACFLNGSECGISNMHQITVVDNSCS